MPVLEALIDYWKVICTLAIIFLYIFYQHKVSMMILAITGFQLSRLFSTVVFGGDFWVLARTCGEVISFSMLIELYAKRNVRLLMKGLVGWLSFLCIVNLICTIVFPDGLYSYNGGTGYWVFGYDNGNVVYVLPLLCCFAIWGESCGYSTTFCLFSMIVFSAPIFITWSATSMVSVFIFLALYLLMHMKVCPKSLNIRFFYIVTAVVFIGVVVFRVQDLFRFLIEDILHKDLTFTGRLRIWDRSMKWFLHSPLIGNGVLNVEVDAARLGGVYHCHNYYLDILYRTGLLGMGTFMIILHLLAKKLMQVQESHYSFIIMAAMAGFLLLFQLDVFFSMSPIYMLITLGYHIQYIITGLENNEGEQLLRHRRRSENAG